MIALAVMVLLLPLMMWLTGSRKFRALQPQEQNLTRAANGAALMALAVLGLTLLYGKLGWSGFVTALYNRTDAMQLALLFVALFSLARAIYGARKVWGFGDGTHAFRGFMRLAGGAVGVYYLRNVPALPWDEDNRGWMYLFTALYVLSWWELVGGAVRFVLMLGLGGALHGPALGNLARMINLPWVSRIRSKHISAILCMAVGVLFAPYVASKMQTPETPAATQAPPRVPFSSSPSPTVRRARPVYPAPVPHHHPKKHA